MKSKLQEQFEKENNVNVCDSSGRTFRLYIKWLEDKINDSIPVNGYPQLSDIRAKLENYSVVHKAFEERIRHGENDSWDPHYVSMKEKGWEQAIEWVLELMRDFQS